MAITFDGGTDRQRNWVNDAVANCAFPLSALPDFTVTWADKTPCGARHTYMCTSDNTVTIESWADVDSSGQPPIASMFEGSQLHEFYMESFVHEMGHVAAFNNISDPAAAAALFTHIPDGRQGTIEDMSRGPWSERIAEAIAEWFKIAYYRGTLIYFNRTSWHLTEDNFKTLCDMFGGSGGGPFIHTGRMWVEVTNFFNPNPVGVEGLGGPEMVPAFQLQVAGLTADLASSVEATLVMTPGDSIHAPVGHSDVIDILTEWVPDYGGESFLDPDIGQDAFLSVGIDDNSTYPTTGNTFLVPVVPPSPPFWLALNIETDRVTAELWSTDPSAGGSPDATASLALGPPGVLFPVLDAWCGGMRGDAAVVESPSVSLRDWQWPGGSGIGPSGVDATDLTSVGPPPGVSGGVLTFDSQAIDSTLAPGINIAYFPEHWTWYRQGGSTPGNYPSYPPGKITVTAVGSGVMRSHGPRQIPQTARIR